MRPARNTPELLDEVARACRARQSAPERWRRVSGGEVRAVLDEVRGRFASARLMYGAGLRLLETLSIRARTWPLSEARSW
ncbi:MAG TPA: hypothetical protein VMM79_18710 [Longimicrobiales bacterium]|nr:hypothetical protein [Longimicrobiales bacterium]